MDELGLVRKPGQARARQLDHRLREVDPYVMRGAGVEHELADPSRAAADIEDARVAIGADRVGGELAAAKQAGPEQPGERPLVLI